MLADGERGLGVKILLERYSQREDPSEIRMLTRTADADPEGRFELTGLPAGVYELKASCDCYSPHVRAVRLEEGRGTGPVRIVLGRGGAVLVTVLSSDGTPRPGSPSSSVRFRRCSRRRCGRVKTESARFEHLEAVTASVEGQGLGRRVLIVPPSGAVEVRCSA